MAQLWRENNRARWVGIRPAHDGAQIIDTSTVSNAVDTMLTAAAGKRLLLFSWWAWSVATGAGTASLGIYNAVPALSDRLVYHRHVAAGERNTHHDLFVPIEIPSGWSIRNETNAAAVTQEAWTFVIEIDG